MMSNIKNIIIVVVVIVAVLFGYLFFFNKNPDVANLDSSTTTGATDTSIDVTGGIGGDFISTLLNIKNIALDASVLSDPAFATLRDSSIELIPDGTEGRPNPFAPIGVDTGTVPLSTNTAVPTTPAQNTPVKSTPSKNTPVKSVN